MDILRLLEISEKLGLSEIESSLHAITEKKDLCNCPIILPLVGEFSAGKTSLINALMENGPLETGFKETTATIYEIFFSQNDSFAEILDSEGNLIKRVNDIRELKNTELADTPLVRVYDTSKRVPSSVVLVDTPGLSAPDPRHRQALVDYFPKADGILLISDVNQQLTASLLSFIKTATLANRPIFLVITQCDSKAQSEVEAARRYAASITGLPECNISCVSAYKGQLDEFYSLLAGIQKDKSRILGRVLEYRISEIKQQLRRTLDQLIKTAEPGVDLSGTIQEQKRKADRLKREIESLVETAKSDIDNLSRISARKFEDQVFDQLDSLAASDGANYDVEARSIVDSTMRVLFNEYKASIQNVLSRKAREEISSDASINLSGLLSIDLSSLDIGEMPYNLNLNELGHEYDKRISTGIKVAAAVALAAAVVSTAGGAAGAAGSVASGASTAGTAAQVAGSSLTAGEFAQVASTFETVKKGAEFLSKASEQYGLVDAKDHAQSERGTLECLVGTITDRSLGKPQRRRAIHQYVDLTLAPSYRIGLESITGVVINAFSDVLKTSVSSRLQELAEALQSAQKQQSENDAAFRERIRQLKEFQAELNND